MKVLFIYPDIAETFSKTFHYGLGYLSAVLESAGHSTSLLHLTAETSERRFHDVVSRTQPELVAFTATTHQFPYVRRYSEWVKRVGNIPVICGGIHATLRPDEVIAVPGIDMLCVGEGEYALLELVEERESGRDPLEIESLWIKRNGRVHRNPIRPLVVDLDALPFANRAFDSRIRVNRVGDMMAGRGCPFKCSYCCNHSLVELYRNKGRFVRYRSVNSVIEEATRLIDDYGVQSLDFHDDTFTLKRSWVLEFCEKYRRHVNIPFICNGHPRTLKREILEALKSGCCSMLRIGVESGNEQIRREVLNRDISDDQLRMVFGDAHEIGLQTSSFNMVGIPGETPEVAEDTLRLNQELNPTRAVVSVFYPYPLTDLHKRCEEQGLITDRVKPSHTDAGSTLDLPTLTEAQINKLYQRFKNFFYRKEIAARSPHLVWLYKALETVTGRTHARLSWIRTRWVGYRIREIRELFYRVLRHSD